MAEFIPALGANFENPQLMREFGLFLENQDGFGDLAANFNMRGVPHTLALRTSVGVASDQNGWAGDGAPANCPDGFPEERCFEFDGTLRAFALVSCSGNF